jgi:hypothetical protein
MWGCPRMVSRGGSPIFPFLGFLCVITGGRGTAPFCHCELDRCVSVSDLTR